jgi:type I restriction enzyme, S subunit
VNGESGLSLQWIETAFGELFSVPRDDIVDGPFGSNLKASEYVEAGIPIARLQNIDRNRFLSKNIQFVSVEKADELVRHTFRPGDILITKLGDPLGKACLAPDGFERGVLVADVVRARITHQWVDRRFLCYQINSAYIVEQFKDQTKGTTRPRVNLTKIRALRARLCPLPEQVRIVAKLEELLSDLDAGVAELQAARKKLQQYRQSLLKAAVEGALTADWREAQRQQGTPAETGAQLLARILTERRAQWEAKQLAKFKEQGKAPPKDWQNKYPEPVKPDTSDLPSLPMGWVWASLDMLGEIASGVAKGTKRDASVSVREVHYLRVANVQRGYLDLSEVKTILATERDINELTLKNGDVLFNEGGDRDKLGRGWVWRDEVAECIHQNHVFRMRPYSPDLRPELISHHGNTFGKLWFQTAGKQTTNLASSN